MIPTIKESKRQDKQQTQIKNHNQYLRQKLIVYLFQKNEEKVKMASKITKPMTEKEMSTLFLMRIVNKSTEKKGVNLGNTVTFSQNH